MAKPINKKCSECHVRIPKMNCRIQPDCYVASKCSRIRNYYRYLKIKRAKQRSYHRYLKYRGDKCCLCWSRDRLEVHHIKPQAEGGCDSKNNLITLCNACHVVVTKYNTALAQLRGINTA